MRGGNWANGVTINAASNFRGITYGQGRYVAVGSNGALYSCTYNGLASAASTGCPNGAAWTAETLPTVTSSSPASTNDLNSVAYNSYTGQFVAVGAAGDDPEGHLFVDDQDDHLDQRLLHDFVDGAARPELRGSGRHRFHRGRRERHRDHRRHDEQQLDLRYA